MALYPSTDSSATVSFVRIHTADGGRIRHQPECSLERTEVPPGEIGRGYKPGDSDVIVPLTDADLEALPLPTVKTMTILAFVAGSDIDPLRMGHGFYLGADGPAAVKPYVLLRDAMERHKRIGLGKVALHGGESLAMIRPAGPVLVLQLLLWPHQIHPMDGVLPARQAHIADEELEAAEELMDAHGALAEQDLHDALREGLDEIAAAKLAHRRPEFEESEQPPLVQPVDLMAALQDSVRAAKELRGEPVTSRPGRSATKAASSKTTRDKKAASTARKPAGRRHRQG